MNRALLLTMLVSCGGAVESERTDRSEEVVVHGEVAGRVMLSTGDCRTARCSERPVKTVVHLYPRQPKPAGYHVSQVVLNGDVVAITETNDAGEFALRAAPGTYSLLTVYEDRFEPRVHSNAGWAIVIVEANERINRDITIDRATE